MKIDDLIQLLNNRLREFKLSRDYAKMSGDLGRMNTADKEIIGLEDTLYQLNLLVDTSRSAAVREDILSEVITDGSIAVLGEYDITPYATDPLHEEKIMNILSKMGVMDSVEKIDDYIDGKYLSSPITGEMVMSAASAYSVDTRLMMAIMEQDSSLGTAGVAVRTRNPGNVGNDDAGNTRAYESWQEGVTAVAGWLSRHRGTTPTPTPSPTTEPTPEEPTEAPEPAPEEPAAEEEPPVEEAAPEPAPEEPTEAPEPAPEEPAAEEEPPVEEAAPEPAPETTSQPEASPPLAETTTTTTTTTQETATTT